MPGKTLVGTLQMETPEGEAAYEVAKSAHDEMVSMGIYLPEKPEFDAGQFVHPDGSPKMPPNVQELADSEIGELYYIVLEYFAYVIGQFARVNNEYAESQEVFKFVAAKVRLGKEGKVQDKNDRQIADRRYVLANAKALELKCLYNLLSKVRDKLDADMKMISRSITLRDQRIKTGGRGNSIDARKKFRRELVTSEHYEAGWEEGEAEPVEEEQPRVTKRRPPRRRPAIPGKKR